MLYLMASMKLRWANRGGVAIITMVLVMVLVFCCLVKDGRVSAQQFNSSMPLIGVDEFTHYLVGIDSEDTRFRLFHGVNMVIKYTPYFPTAEYISPESLQNLTSWGFNVIRLGTMWVGTEPVRGQYNQTYVDELIRVVKLCAEYGIYVLLDAHQDLYSAHMCGDGAPFWAVQPSNDSLPFALPVGPKMDYSDGGYPTNCSSRSWSTFYFSEATSSAFQNLYDNVNELRDSYAAFWKFIASNFVSFNNVIGYELMNEPWAGNIYRDPLLMVPDYTNHKNLQPFYEYIAEAIREVDDRHMIFYETVTWTFTNSGFTSVPGGPEYANRSVMAYHFYCIEGDNFMDRVICDYGLGDNMFVKRREDIEEIGGSSFLTEFGLCDASSTVLEYVCDFVMDKADEFFQSWAYWDWAYQPVTDDNIRFFGRTYPQLTAGIPLGMSFDTETSKFSYSWNATQINSELPTVIFFNQQFRYPNGFNLTLNTDAVYWTNEQANFINLFYNTSKISFGDVIIVAIEPL